MADLLTRGIDKEARIRSEGTHKFKDSPLGRIPQEWDIKSLGKIAYFNSGYAFKNEELSETGMRIVRISNLHKEDFKYWHYNGPIKENWLVSTGDLLFSWAGVSSSIDVYIYKGERALINQHIYNFIIKDNNMKLLVYYYLQYLLSNLRKSIEGGAGQLHLSKDKIEGIQIILPPESECEKIISILETHEIRIRTEEAYLDKLLMIKKGLMQDILIGRVRVKIPQEAET
jgi:type I restriction enzyme S subunit